MQKIPGPTGIFFFDVEGKGSGMNASGWGFALLFCGAYLLPASATELALANALAEEGDWEACRTECLRAAAANPGLSEIRELLARVDAKRSIPEDRKSIWHRAGGWPIRVLVGFYRSAIGPAIGNRCVLEPSCSRYAMEAVERSGWLSIPMTADRLIREPSVVREGQTPVTDMRGRIRYADPVSDHVGRKAGL